MFYGWVIVIASWFVYLCLTSAGAYGTSIITTQLVMSYGWSEHVIGLTSSVMGAAGMAGSLVAGIILKKVGCRRMILIGCTISFAGYMILAWLNVSETVYIITFSAFGFSSILGGVVTLPCLISTWFEKNRAFPMSILMTAGAVGGFLFPIIAERVSAISMTAPYKLYGMLTLFSFVLTACILKDSPEVIGEVKDGRKWTECHVKPLVSAGDDVKASAKNNRIGGITLYGIYHMRAFYMLGLCMYSGRAMLIAFISYGAIYAIESGASASESAMILSIYGITGLVGRAASGYADRIPLPRQVTNFINFIVLAAGMLILALADNLIYFYIASALIGIGYGYQCTYFALMVTDYFGDSYYSILYGLYNSIGSIGTMTGPILVMVIAGVFGGYHAAYLFFAVLLMVCAMLAIATPADTKERMGYHY